MQVNYVICKLINHNRYHLNINNFVINLVRYILALPFILIFLISYLLNSISLGISGILENINNPIFKFMFEIVTLIIMIPFSLALFICVYDRFSAFYSF
jgi:hypothetical protein